MPSGCSNQAFFSVQFLDSVSKATIDAGTFFVTPNFDVWKNFPGSRPNEFVSLLRSYYHKFVLERRKACEGCYIDCNKDYRQTQKARSRRDAAAGRLASAMLIDKDARSETAKSVTRKNSVKRGNGSIGSSTSKSSLSKKKQKPYEMCDPDVVHRIK